MAAVLFIVGTLLVLLALAWVTYQSGKFLRMAVLRDNLLLAPLENVVKAAIIALCIGLAALSGLPAAQFGWSFAHPGADVIAGLLVGLLVPFVVNAVTRWAIARFGKEIYSSVVLRNIFPRSRREWLLVPLAMLLAVGLEEVLFRALLVGGMSAFAPPALLVVGGGAIFGVMHGPQGSLGVVVSALLGMGLSGMFLWSGSLLAPLLAHYLINLLQLLRAREEWGWLQEY